MVFYFRLSLPCSFSTSVSRRIHNYGSPPAVTSTIYPTIGRCRGASRLFVRFSFSKCGHRGSSHPLYSFGSSPRPGSLRNSHWRSAGCRLSGWSRVTWGASFAARRGARFCANDCCRSANADAYDDPCFGASGRRRSSRSAYAIGPRCALRYGSSRRKRIPPRRCNSRHGAPLLSRQPRGSTLRRREPPKAAANITTTASGSRRRRSGGLRASGRKTGQPSHVGNFGESSAGQRRHYP